MGSAELELLATYSTEKSKVTKACTSAPIAVLTSTNCPATAGLHDGLPARIAARGAEDAEECLRAGEHQREDQGEMSELGNHQVPTLRARSGGGGLSLSDSATSGGMYFSSCLARISSATNVSALHAAVRHHALPLAEQVRQDA